MKLIFVPQNGGRLMQVIFNEHPYLFVNPRYAGKYLPPSTSQWFNYGGDKLWVLPEGNDDEQHWVGNSDVLDDGPFEFQTLSQGPRCEISLTGPADPQTGLQFSRTVSIGSGFTTHQVSCHREKRDRPSDRMVRAIGLAVRHRRCERFFAPQSETSGAFSRTNPSSSYLNRYHVKFGPAENSAVQVRENGLFAGHYVPLAAELWIDSKDGWLAVVDGDTRYAMVERFHYDESRQYPGKASVIFWINGPELRQHPDGSTTFGSDGKEPPTFYMEAELNSPMVRLEPGEAFNFDTQWFPTRADSDFKTSPMPGVVLKPLRATQRTPTATRSGLTGSFGVFFRETRGVALRSSWHLIARRALMEVDPQESCFVANHSDRRGRRRREFLCTCGCQWIGPGITGRSAG